MKQVCRVTPLNKLRHADVKTAARFPRPCLKR